MSGLKPFLFPGAKILDVGCGPGTITVDVSASGSHPEIVTGLDSSEKMIDQAREVAKKAGVGNCSFEVGDARSLPYDNQTYDITYSNALLDFLADPAQALVEQARVTKTGGVVFSRMADFGTQVYYPRCPAVDQLIDALKCLQDASDPERFWNPFLGHEAFAIFSKAGFSEMTIEGWADCIYRGSEDFERSLVHPMIQGLSEKSDHPLLGKLFEKLFEENAVDKALLREARDEIAALYNHSNAFSMRAGIFVAATVP